MRKLLRIYTRRPLTDRGWKTSFHYKDCVYVDLPKVWVSYPSPCLAKAKNYYGLSHIAIGPRNGNLSGTRAMTQSTILRLRVDADITRVWCRGVGLDPLFCRICLKIFQGLQSPNSILEL